MSETNLLPNYEGKYKEQLKINHDNVGEELREKNKGLIKKINTFSTKSDYSFKTIVKKIREDKIFSFIFAKDPAKQNLFEKLAIGFIKEIPFITNVKKLPGSGKNALFIIDGMVINEREKKKQNKVNTKSIDFYWECGDKHFYAFHKYTREGGGMQDSQYHDITTFIREANKSSTQKNYFIAIADGDYYSSKHEGSEISKIEKMKELSKEVKRVYAVKIEELAGLLKSLCK